MTIATAAPLRPRWPGILFNAALHVGALFVLLPQNFSWSAVGLTAFLWWVTGCLGITVGYHRLIAHRSFTVPKWLEYIFVICGTLTAQGGVLVWVSYHRAHHKGVDSDGDPHTPVDGFWWSHMGWLMVHHPLKGKCDRFIKDIIDDPVYRFCDRYFIEIQAAFAVLLYLIGGWPFVVWGVFFRLIFVTHVTCMVNSVTHTFGYRNYNSKDRSTNNWIVAALTHGEGWHNNHHGHKYSAKFGHKWWEIDVGWWVIQCLAALGLAKNIKLPKISSSEAV
jgi:stearoyl-CoA desaturase (delta-9 desaturase)